MKILIHGRAFPIAMWRWFDWAFRDLGHQVFSVGNYDGGKIPWGPEFDFPQYAFPPDHQIPEMEAYPIESVLKAIDFKPDVIVQASDVTYLSGKAPCKNVILMTDPHSVDYTPRLQFADHVFNMQNAYREDGQTWIPYAFYPPIHRHIPNLERKYDVVFSGLQYDSRRETLERLQNEGFKVLTTLGLLYEEYVTAYNSGDVAFNWSSKNDLPARFWEGLAMRRMVLTNRCPDLEQLEFKEDVHYVGFSTVEEAVEKTKFYLKNYPIMHRIQNKGYQAVQPHTYYARAKKMLGVIEAL